MSKINFSSKDIILTIEVAEQVASRLCWASIAAALLKYYNPERTISQKEIAIDVFTENNYNHVYSPEKMLKRIGHFKMAFERPLGLEEIRAELAEGRPLAACMRFFIGWHLVVIYGITANDKLFIADPLHGHSTLDINEFSHSYHGVYRWSHTYQTQRFYSQSSSSGGSALTVDK